MKINIIGPSCVGKSTLASIIARQNKWKHFDLDLVFIDRNYLAQTKIFRYRPKVEYDKRIKEIVDENNNWIVEGVYLVEEVLEKADMIIFINLPILVPLQWQWKRYFTDSNQRSTYGFLNNLGLTREIFYEYFKKNNPSDFGDETKFCLGKYSEVLKKYRYKIKTISKVRDVIRLQKTGEFHKL